MWADFTESAGPVAWLFAAVAVAWLATIIGVVVGEVSGRRRRRGVAERQLWKWLIDPEASHPPRESLYRMLSCYHSLSQRMNPSDAARDRLLTHLGRSRVAQWISRRLGSGSFVRRLEAASVAITLGLGSDELLAPQLTQAALTDERRVIRLRALTALAMAGSTDVLDGILDEVIQEPEWFRRQIAGRLSLYGDRALPFVRSALERWGAPGTHHETHALVVLLEIAGTLRATGFRDQVAVHLRSPEPEVARAAVRTWIEGFGLLVRDEEVLRHADPLISSLTLNALALHGEDEDRSRLVEMLGDDPSDERLIDALTVAANQRPQTFESFVESFRGGARFLASVLGTRLRYLIAREDTSEMTADIIAALLDLGRIEQLVAILARRSPGNIEPVLKQALLQALPGHPDARRRIAEGVPRETASAIGLTQDLVAGQPQEQFRGLRGERIWLGFTLAGLLGTVAGIFVARNWQAFSEGSATVVASLAVVRYMKGFGVYSVAIHGLYTLLALIAIFHGARQIREWRLRVSRYLYAPGVLPELTILVPAHNEEQTITENINSLLRLDYPNYRIVLVSDGSTDATMAVATREFELERIGRTPLGGLDTRSVRAVYRSRRVHNLVVIDKEGGGKADALNAGMNYSNTPLICTIDADSLLAPDAILQAVYRNVLSENEAIAVGGTVVPVNGSEVVGGWIRRPRVGTAFLPSVQTVEYMRAFNAGRVGWTRLRSLLIISGAFGVFSRRRVVEAGGYLTSSSYFHRSTMAEDMELVVRLAREMRWRRLPYTVNHAMLSACWTQVPEHFSDMYRQRRRWHRGLLDVLLFHRRMAFNPRFGRIGTVAIPYFVIFEVFGPFLELLGYVSLVAGIALSVVDIPVATLLFTGAILFGMVVSALGVAISQRATTRFTFRSTLWLLLVSVIENFGYRQVVSAFRAVAFVGYLFRKSSWQQPRRTGFAAAAPAGTQGA